MSNELDAILTGSEQIQKLLHFLHTVYTEERITLSNIALNRQIADSLMRVTDNGTKVPYIMPYGAEYSMFGSQLIQKMKEYNQNNKKENRIDYFTTKGIDGKQVIWTNEKGADIINKLRKELAISKGLYFTEISKDDMINSSQNEILSIIKDVNLEDISLLKNKPLKNGNDYSFSVMEQENGKYSLIVNKNDFINFDVNKNDLFKDLVHVKAAQFFNDNTNIAKELSYDRDMKNRVLNYTPEDLNTPSYITSSTDGGRYIEISKTGFTVYNTGMNINDLRQTVALKMEYPKNENDLKEYKKQLYREISKLNRPVEINDKIYKQHEFELKKVFGDNPPDLSKDSKCVDKIRGKFEKHANLDFEPELSPNDPDALIKQFIYKDKRDTVLTVASKAAVDIVKRGDIPTKENINKAIERQDIEKLLKNDFFKNQLYHENKELCIEFNHAIQNTLLYQSLQNSKINSDVKNDIDKIINDSYGDFLKEVDEDLRGRINSEYKKYKDSMKENIEKCIEDNLSVKDIGEIKDIQNERNNEALQVVLANCITGNPIDCIRPINTSVKTMQDAERHDELAKAFAKEIESALLEKYPDKNIPENLFEKDEFGKSEFDKIVKSVSKELQKEMNDGILEDRSKEWSTIYDVCNERGEMNYRTWDELAELSSQVIKGVPKEIVSNPVEFEKFAKMEHLKDMSGDYLDILDFEHDEEEITRALCDKIQEEDIEFTGDRKTEDLDFEPDYEDLENDLENEMELELE